MQSTTKTFRADNFRDCPIGSLSNELLKVVLISGFEDADDPKYGDTSVGE